jgi:hemerythrin
MLNPQAHALGIAEIDDAHDAFLRELAILQRAGDEDFPHLFDEFYRHLRAHFDAESRLMREYGFPTSGDHEAEHARVLDDVALIGRGVARRKLGLARAYTAVALGRWFHNHLTGMDRALAAFLETAKATTPV